MSPDAAWAVFAGVLAGLVLIIYGLACDTRHWLDGRPHDRDDWQPSLFVHVTYDGEIIEYPTCWDCSADDIADFLGQLEALPEAIEA